MAGVEAAIVTSEDLGATWNWYEMIHALYQAPAYHLLFEAALILWIVRMLFTKSYKIVDKINLTQKEKDQLIEEWTPDPLVPDVPDDHPALHNVLNRLVDSKIGKYVTINGRECLNLASFNFLSMMGKPEITEAALEAINQYGVGTCGPRGFYGTMNAHLIAEANMAKFMECEEAALFQYGFATIATIIPAYAMRGDVIFCDEAACFAIQKGILASRSNVYYFKHNDMDDLERLLKDQEKRDKKDKSKARVTRRFIAVEGIYINLGDICPLPKLVELKNKYKVRIFLEESISFGVLGAHGKGVTEHCGVPVDEIDFLCFSVENALASLGGMCVGKAYIIDHQRLSGQGYSFSASIPTMNANAADCALSILQDNPDILTTLENNCKYIHKRLKQIHGIKVVGEEISPVKHLHLRQSSANRKLDYSLLQAIVNLAEEKGIALTQAAYLEEEIFLPPPSIRITVSKDLTREDMNLAMDILSQVCQQVLAQQHG